MGQTTKNIAQKGTTAVKDATQKSGQMADNVAQKGSAVKGKLSKYASDALTAKLKKWLPGLTVAGIGSGVAYELYTNWDKYENYTLDQWVEEFRKFLSGVPGIIIQVILALSGVGNILNIAANGFILAYDIGVKGLEQDKWNWYNILSGMISLIGTGLLASGFQFLKGIGNVAPKAIGPAVAKSFPDKIPVMMKVGQGAGYVIRQIGSALEWFLTKIPLVGRVVPALKSKLASVGQAIDDFAFSITRSGSKLSTVTGYAPNVSKGVGKHFETSAFKNLKVKPGAHFDRTHLAQKLTSKTDQKLAKGTTGQFVDKEDQRLRT